MTMNVQRLIARLENATSMVTGGLVRLTINASLAYASLANAGKGTFLLGATTAVIVIVVRVKMAGAALVGLVRPARRTRIATRIPARVEDVKSVRTLHFAKLLPIVSLEIARIRDARIRARHLPPAWSTPIVSLDRVSGPRIQMFNPKYVQQVGLRKHVVSQRTACPILAVFPILAIKARLAPNVLPTKTASLTIVMLANALLQFTRANALTTPIAYPGSVQRIVVWIKVLNFIVQLIRSVLLGSVRMVSVRLYSSEKRASSTLIARLASA
jgi:hypothetical protein